MHSQYLHTYTHQYDEWTQCWPVRLGIPHPLTQLVELLEAKYEHQCLLHNYTEKKTIPM